MKKTLAVFLMAVLLAPAYVGAQSGGIVLLDNFGNFSKGESVFIYGNAGVPTPNSFLILKITNPNGDICQIQQILPLQDGTFVMDKVPLRGNICGMAGSYEVEVFYGDRKSIASFSVSTSVKPDLTDSQYAAAANEYVSQVINDVAPADSTNLNSRLAAASGDLRVILYIFKDTVGYTITDKVLYGVDAALRPAVYSFLNAADDLEQSGKISPSTKMTLTDDVITSIFYYQIGDKTAALDIIYRTYDVLTGADPTTEIATSVPYEDLEDTLLNLMTKTGSVMSRDVQKEIALIFSRGQGPIYVDELGGMLDFLTKTRFLDVVLLKNDPLYSVLKSEWETERITLVEKNTVAKLLAQSSDVNEMHEAAILLRGLDRVERFISTPTGTSEENLAALIEPEWTSLQRYLNTASSAQSILEKSSEIKSIKSVTQISERISKAVDLSGTAGIGVELSGEWAALLSDVDNARSLEEILSIVSRFDATIIELREKRNPIAILTFEYRRMAEQAQRQADYANLAVIEEAIKILEAAARLNAEGSTAGRIDRVELLLTWVSEKAPIIREDLDAYTDVQFKERAGKILHRANSLNALVYMALENHRFEVGFEDFADSIMAKVDRVQSLVVAERLHEADEALDAAYDEWQIILKMYSDNPDTEVPFTLIELKRIEYRKLIQLVDDAVDRYANANFNEHTANYDKLRSSLDLSLSLGNFATVENKLENLLSFVSENLDSSNNSIKYKVEYDEQTGIWSTMGFLDKDNDIRVNLVLGMYDPKGDLIQLLEFGDTKNGKFSTFWIEKVEPGLYAMVLNWHGTTSTKIIHIQDRSVYDVSQDDPQLVEASAKYEMIKVFVQKFGGSQYTVNSAAFTEIEKDVEEAINEGDYGAIVAGTLQLQTLAERYLPHRERAAIIDVSYGNGLVRITGAVEKLVQFSEDLYVDIYDGNGDVLLSVAVKDTPTGYIEESININLESGLYVARIQYHDLVATDFFSAN